MGNEERQVPGHKGGNDFFCRCAKYRPYFTCCVHREDIAGSRGRATGREIKEGQSPPKAETLLAFGHAMEAANLPVFYARKQLLLSARLSHRNSVRPFVCPSVRYTGGSVKNGAR